MGFLSSVKAWVVGVVAVIVAGLGVALKIVLAQRNRARDESERLRRQAAVKKEQRRIEQQVLADQHAARMEANQRAKKEADRIAAGDRPDAWGDPRLRDED